MKSYVECASRKQTKQLCSRDTDDTRASFPQITSNACIQTCQTVLPSRFTSLLRLQNKANNAFHKQAAAEWRRVAALNACPGGSGCVARHYDAPVTNAGYDSFR